MEYTVIEVVYLNDEGYRKAEALNRVEFLRVEFLVQSADLHRRRASLSYSKAG